MKQIRIPEGTWRPDGRLFHFGIYRVPEDMPEELAQRAVDEGVAVWVLDAAPPVEFEAPPRMGKKKSAC